MQPISRRQLLRSMAAGAVVVGWSARTRTWIPAHAAASCTFDDVPPLDGVLLQDDVSRSLAADDYGHIVHRRPCAVLRPGSVEDVVRMVRFARERAIPVSMRGQGQSSYGQSQVDGGIVIDSSTMTAIHALEPDHAIVEPGVTWRTLIGAAAARGTTPPALTDYQDLTVGGTLSLGGLDSGPMPYGTQADNTLELEVVTGEGERVVCSEHEHRDLFEAVLAGLGQCGIIVRATIRMIPAPTFALYVRLRYEDLATNLEDVSMVLRDKRFDAFEEFVTWEDGRWIYEFQGAVYFTPPAVPDTDALLEGLHDDASRRVVTTIPYLAWTARLDPYIAQSKAAGPAGARVVVLNVLLPESDRGAFIGNVLSSLTPADLGGGRMFLVAASRRAVRRPLVAFPDEHVHAIIVVRVARTEADAARFLAWNRERYDEALAAGGRRYPWDAIPAFTQTDWARHFGDAWGMLSAAKRRYDPAGILGTGLEMFRP